MSRYASATRRPSARAPQTPAIWRGIGCLLIIIVPIVAWLLAEGTLTRALAAGWPLPYQLLGYPVVPEGLWSIPGLYPILLFIRGQQHLYMKLLLTLAYVVLISATLSLIYALIYRVTGPPRYGPLDLPQPEVKVGRYKR